MENVQIKIGCILYIQEERLKYRILYMDDKSIDTCAINDTSKLDFRLFSLNTVVEKIKTKEIRCIEDHPMAVDFQNLSPAQYDKYQRYKQAITELEDIYGPTFRALAFRNHKQRYDDILQKYQIPRSTMQKLISRYLQSGKSNMSLLDKRTITGLLKRSPAKHPQKKTGRPSDDELGSQVIVDDIVKSHFDAAITYYVSQQGNKHFTIGKAYEWMCNKFYTQTKRYTDGSVSISSFPERHIPTERQFRYYFSKNVTTKERHERDKGVSNVYNNERLLLGSELNDVHGPGYLVEVDACELNIALVSRTDRKQSIGRAVLYLMIDVYTHMILAISVGLDNNSLLGLTNLFLNLFDDKIVYCKKYGFDIKAGIWPSNILPVKCRSDRGSDFRSDQFEDILRRLNIVRELAPAGMGSMKGSVEQSFNLFNHAALAHLTGKGLITRNHNDKHNEEAVMTIDECTKMCIDFVLHHNLESDNNYRLTEDMIVSNVVPTPVNLWEYGIKLYGQPRPIIDKESYLYALMMPAKAQLNREGIHSHHLRYINFNDQDLLDKMQNAQNKKQSVEMRYDPRDMGHLYYLKDGRLQTAFLLGIPGNQEYANYTEGEWNAQYRHQRALIKAGKTINRESKRAEFDEQEKIVSTAAAQNPDSSKPNNIKHIKDARRKENNNLHSENQIAVRLTQAKTLSHDEAPIDVSVEQTIEKEATVKKETKIKLESHSQDNMSDKTVPEEASLNTITEKETTQAEELKKKSEESKKNEEPSETTKQENKMRKYYDSDHPMTKEEEMNMWLDAMRKVRTGKK